MKDKKKLVEKYNYTGDIRLACMDIINREIDRRIIDSVFEGCSNCRYLSEGDCYALPTIEDDKTNFRNGYYGFVKCRKDIPCSLYKRKVKEPKK